VPTYSEELRPQNHTIKASVGAHTGWADAREGGTRGGRRIGCPEKNVSCIYGLYHGESVFSGWPCAGDYRPRPPPARFVYVCAEYWKASTIFHQNMLGRELTIRRWRRQRGGYNCDSTSVRLPFDCSSTALRPFDDLRYDRIGLPVCGLLQCSLNK